MSRIIKNKRVKTTWDDRLFDIVTGFLLIVIVIITFYPIYFVVLASFTDPVYVNSGAVLLFPKKTTLDGYYKVFEDSRVWIGYFNTLLYTVTGTLLGTTMTVMAGYALSRKDLLGRNIVMKMFVFTMYFSGGMIPTYIVVHSMGLVNTRFLMIVLGSFSVYNTIIVRSFMSSTIPDELLEAATIDGCGNGKFFLDIVLPLSKPVISVIALYIAVAHWNAYFKAMLYLTDSNKYPLQLYLRILLFQAHAAGVETDDPIYAERMRTMAQVVKYSIIVVATAPIICMYPFIQKYFVKGVMIGSVKG